MDSILKYLKDSWPNRSFTLNYSLDAQSNFFFFFLIWEDTYKVLMTVTYGVRLAKKSDEEAIHELELLLRIFFEECALGAMTAGIATLPHTRWTVTEHTVKATASNHRLTEGWLVSTHARSKYLRDYIPLLICFCNLVFSTVEINLLSNCTKWANMVVLTQLTLRYSFDMQLSAITLWACHNTIIAITVCDPAFGIQRHYWSFGLKW